MTDKKLIIIADDFGISKGVNKAIKECVELEIITGASVLSTGEFCEEITVLNELYPKLDVGIHLDLISNKFLTNLDLHTSPQKLLLRLIYDKKILLGIEKEFRAQIEKLGELVSKISHIDSHRHVHFIPKLFKLVNALSEEYGINRVRIPVPKITRQNFKFIFSRKDFYKFFPFFIFKYLNKTNAASNDDFFGLFQVGNLTEKYIDYIFQTADFHYAEFMVHPGYVDDYLKNTNENLLFEREKELQILKTYFYKKDEI